MKKINFLLMFMLFLLISCKKEPFLQFSKPNLLNNQKEAIFDFNHKIEQNLGENSTKNQFFALWHDKNGNLIKSYSYSLKKLKLADFLPIFSYFLPKNYQNYEILVVFNQNNQVIEVKEFNDIKAFKAAILCSEANFSCF